MVDVTEKPATEREAVARAAVSMRGETFALIREGGIEKGDVFEVAKIAGIMAAKKTGELIPMCHPLQLTSVDIRFHPREDESSIEVESRVKTVGKTGVEMEAMVAASVAALTIYDMCKAVDREMTVHDIRLISKSGGKSGEFVREE
jgi:cyclic pyranopterin phosphate synthase